MKFMMLSLLVALLAIQPARLALTCEEFIDGLISKLPNFDTVPLSQEEKYYLAYSARRPRDLGDRKACEQAPQMKYFVLVNRWGIYGDDNYQEENAICLPEQCTKELVRSDDALLRKMFLVNKWGMGGDNIEFYDVNEGVPKNVAFYLSSILHFILITLAVVSTIIVIRAERQRRKDKNESNQAVALRHYWLCEAFDIKRNLISLYQTAKEQKQNENISIFGFLRVISVWWVAGLHTLVVYPRMSTDPGKCEGLCAKIQMGAYGVEYFFFMGGFLAFYILIPKIQREGLTVRKYFDHFKHRFIRIWPQIMMALLFYWCVIKYMFKTPVWGRYIGTAANCDKYWWQKVLVIDNLVIQDNIYCMGWAWYANTDIQCYLLVILVAYGYTKRKWIGYVSALALILQSLLLASFRHDTWGHSIYYMFAPVRWNEIFIGGLFGMHYYEYAKLKPRYNLYSFCEKSKIFRYGVVLLGLFIDCFVVFIYPNWTAVIEKNKDEWVLESKVCICFATGLFFGPLMTTKSDWLKSFMNLRVWQVLAKLSFGVYLFQFPIIFAILFTTDQLHEKFSTGYLLGIIIEVIAISYVVSLGYWLLVEKPILTIEAHFMKKAARKPMVAQEQRSKTVQEQDQVLPEQDRLKLMDPTSPISPISPPTVEAEHLSKRVDESIEVTKRVDDNIELAKRVDDNIELAKTVEP